MTTLIGYVTNSDQIPLQNLPERTPSEDELLRRQQDYLSARIRVALPCSVVSFNSSKQTIVAQPLIREKIIDRTSGEIQWIQLPQLLDVPVCFPQAGPFVLTMPIQAGDEVLVVFNDMCLDSWWESGGIQNWNDRRRHDLSDAIAVVGINSVPNVTSDIANNATELRTKDGNCKVSIYEDKITIKHDDQKIEMTDSSIVLQFDGSNKITISSSGIDLTGTLKINGHNYLSHIHGGVDTGPGFTAPVTP